MVLNDDDVIDWDDENPPLMGDECPQGIFSYCAKYFSDRTLDQMYVSLWFWTTNFFLSKHFISFLHGILFLSIVPVHN